MARPQNTIRTESRVDGIGLHTGCPSRLRFLPAPPGHGICFKRIDLPEHPLVPATIDKVTEVLRGTTIGLDDVRVVHTVEHVLSAAYGLCIDNLLIELDGNEPPAGDGSARVFVEALEKAGIVAQPEGAAPEVLALNETFFIEDGDRSLAYRPSSRFEITFTIVYPNSIIGQQTRHVVIDDQVYRAEVKDSRTFGFIHEFEGLKAKNLALGGNLDNAVVIARDGNILNEGGVRFEREFVTHKILDLVGDLALIGRPIRGHIIAHKSGHAFNIRFARLLAEKAAAMKTRRPEKMLDINMIRQVIPHRYPFLLVDRILAYEMGQSAVGIKNVTANEEFFQGHFPRQPVMPGVLIVEAMAQVAGVLLLSQPEHKGKVPYFVGIDNVRFRKPVIPGDRLEISVKVLKVRGNTGRVAAECRVEDKLVANGELMFTIVDPAQGADA